MANPHQLADQLSYSDWDWWVARFFESREFRDEKDKELLARKMDDFLLKMRMGEDVSVLFPEIWNGIKQLRESPDYKFLKAEFDQKNKLALVEKQTKDVLRASGYPPDVVASLINQLQGGNAITEADVLGDPSYYYNLLRNRQQEASATRASLNSQAQTDFLTQQQASQQATEQREAKRWNTASGGATLQAMMSGQEPVNQNAEFKKWAETILGTLDSPLDARRRAQVQTELDKVRWTEQQTSGQRWDASFRQAQDNLKRAEALEKVAKARLDDPNDNLTYNTLMDMSRPKTPEELSIIAALQAVPQARANLLSVQMGGSPVTWKPSEVMPKDWASGDPLRNIETDLTQPGTFTDWQGKEINPETPISAPTFEPEELVASPSFNWKDRLPWYAKENVAPLGFGRWNTMTDEEKMGLQQFNPSAISAMRNALPNPRQPTRWKPVRQRIG